MNPLRQVASIATDPMGAVQHALNRPISRPTPDGATGVSCTVLCPGIRGMCNGSRSVVPGSLPTAMSIAGRHAPRTALLPLVRTVRNLRGRRDSPD